MANGADFPQAFNKLLVLKEQVENPNPWIPKHWRFRKWPSEERERLEQQWKRRGWIVLNPPLQLGGRHKNGKKNLPSRRKLKTENRVAEKNAFQINKSRNIRNLMWGNFLKIK